MENKMNKDKRILLILATLVVVALLATFWATREPIGSLAPWRHRSSYPGDIELFYTIHTVVSTINIALGMILLFTYIEIYRKTKSDFTVGLIIFSVILLFYTITSNPIMQLAFGFRAFGLGPFAMLPDVFTLIALSVLLYLSVK
jgi:hypothetical protein